MQNFELALSKLLKMKLHLFKLLYFCFEYKHILNSSLKHLSIDAPKGQKKTEPHLEEEINDDKIRSHSIKIST